MVRAGKLTLEEAGKILRKFDDGKLDIRDLALAAALSLPLSITTEATIDAVSESVAGSVLIQRFSRDGRRELSIRTLEEFDDNVFRAARSFMRGQIPVFTLHANFLDEVVNDLYREATLGLGRELLPSELARLRRTIVEQSAYLQRFMDEVAFRNIIGNPYSEKYILARIKQYKGEGITQFYRFAETSLESRNDTIIRYISVDDGGTCHKCIAAQNGGPYLPGRGPMPGSDTCLGRGHCRCRREPETNPAEARRLRGESG